MPTVTVNDSRGLKAISLQGMTAAEWHELFGTGESSKTPDATALVDVVGWLHRCVHLRASALSSMPWAITRGDDVVATHDGTVANDEFDWLSNLGDLLYLTEAALSIVGSAYWYLLRDRRNRIINPRWFAPGTMTPMWDTSAGLTHFERKIGNTTARYAAEDIVYTRLPNALHETLPGASPAQAAAADAGVLFNLDAFAEGYFERGAIRATLLAVQGNVRPDEKERLKAWWQRMISGVSNAWGAGVINADSINPVQVGDGIEALSNTALTTERREGISTAMGVPHSLVMSNAANYATAMSDKRLFYEGTVISESRIVAQSLNRQLFAPIGLALKFEPQTLAVFQEDERDRSSAYLNYVKAGMQPSIAAQVLGIALPNEIDYSALDEPAVTFAVRDQSPVAPPPPDSADDEAKRAEIGQLRRWLKRKGAQSELINFEANHLSDAEKLTVYLDVYGTEDGNAEDTPFSDVTDLNGMLTREAWKGVLRIDSRNPEAERDMRMGVEAEFALALAVALRKWLNLVVPVGATNEDVRRAEFRVIETSEVVRVVMRKFIGIAASLGTNIALDQLETVGIGFDYTLAHNQAAEWAAQHAGALIGRIEETTQRSIRTAVDEWFRNEEPLSELRRDLINMGFSPKRAELIASTEVTRAAAEGSRRAYLESGVVDKIQWQTAEDERVCHICGPLHDKVTAVDGMFTHPDNGLEYYPDAHPRCRCWIVPVIDDA